MGITPLLHFLLLTKKKKLLETVVPHKHLFFSLFKLTRKKNLFRMLFKVQTLIDIKKVFSVAKQGFRLYLFSLIEEKKV